MRPSKTFGYQQAEQYMNSQATPATYQFHQEEGATKLHKNLRGAAKRVAGNDKKVDWQEFSQLFHLDAKDSNTLKGLFNTRTADVGPRGKLAESTFYSLLSFLDTDLNGAADGQFNALNEKEFTQAWKRFWGEQQSLQNSRFSPEMTPDVPNIHITSGTSKTVVSASVPVTKQGLAEPYNDPAKVTVIAGSSTYHRFQNVKTAGVALHGNNDTKPYGNAGIHLTVGTSTFLPFPTWQRPVRPVLEFGAKGSLELNSKNKIAGYGSYTHMFSSTSGKSHTTATVEQVGIAEAGVSYNKNWMNTKHFGINSSLSAEYTQSNNRYDSGLNLPPDKLTSRTAEANAGIQARFSGNFGNLYVGGKLGFYKNRFALEHFYDRSSSGPTYAVTATYTLPMREKKPLATH